MEKFGNVNTPSSYETIEVYWLEPDSEFCFWIASWKLRLKQDFNSVNTNFGG